MTPAQVLDRAVAHMAASRDYAIESRLENSVTFSYREDPNAGLGCFLLLFGLLRGLLYFLLAGGERHTTLLVAEEADGCRVYVGGDAGHGQQALRNWVSSMPGSVALAMAIMMSLTFAPVAIAGDYGDKKDEPRYQVCKHNDTPKKCDDLKKNKKDKKDKKKGKGKKHYKK